MTMTFPMLSPTTGTFIHMVSDSTGDTVVKAMRACLVQFPKTKCQEKLWAFVRTPEHLADVITHIKQQPGLVAFTFIEDTLRQQLLAFCQSQGLPYVSILDPLIQALEQFLGMKTEHQPGRQYVLDDAYFKRISALEYALNHDDGQGLRGLQEADVILVGPSRLSKTPTCMYLGYRGLKAANVPLIKDTEPPLELLQLASEKMIIGLLHDPQHLQSIRQNRLPYLNGDKLHNYVDIDYIQDELRQARRLYAKYGWPIIDTTRRSIEETASRVMQLWQDR